MHLLLICILLVEQRNAAVLQSGFDCYSNMGTVGLFSFLALSSVLAANVAADWPLIDTIFLRFYNRANNSNIDVSLKNARDIVPLLDKSQTTVIYIPAYSDLEQYGTASIMRKALVDSTSANVINLDYSKISILPYPIPVEYAPHIGAALAAAINEMVNAGLDGATIHLIGLSLGAQICGYTGHNNTVKIPRISGLDPAGPLFTTGYLSKGDASFVFILHTDMGGYGNEHVSGDLDCKPNFGRRTQPGCRLLQNVLPPGICSHGRAFDFFVESISNPNAFPSVKCNTDFDFMNGTCDTSSIIPMGYHTPNTASGVYYCQTNSQSRYSLGTPGITYNPSI